MRHSFIEPAILVVFLLAAASLNEVQGQTATPAPTPCLPTQETYESCKLKSKARSDAERYVLDQVRAGKPARLAERFPADEAKRGRGGI